MYSAKTVEKILSGKQMKRSLEAHSTLILALCDIYVTRKICYVDNKEGLINAIDSFKKNFELKTDSEFQSATQSSMKTLETLQLSQLFDR